MGVKWLICKGDHYTPQSHVEVKVRGAVTAPIHAFVVCTEVDLPLYCIWFDVCCQCISYREPI